MEFVDENVLCGANAYKQKYYLNPRFAKLPMSVQQDLQIMCVLFTNDVGGSIVLSFDNDGTLLIHTDHEEDDYVYDEIFAGLRVKDLQVKNRDLFESLEAFYQVLPQLPQ